jgi:hypothetical protein
MFACDRRMSREGKWEGLGGPISVDLPNLADIDPTLDSCCRREEETNRRGSVLRKALQRNDIVAERERLHRNLVSTSSFQGCRCCYDPNTDGGEYRALTELRNDLQKDKFTAEYNDTQLENKETIADDGDEDDSDDEFAYLLDENIPGQNDELAALEDSRRLELEMTILQREAAHLHGYGVHHQMHPARVLKAAGLAPGTRDPPPAVVLHLVDPNSIASASLDIVLEKLAETSARGTKFLRSGGRATLLLNSGLSSKVLPNLGYERDLPALIVVRDGVAVNCCPQLQGLIDDSTNIAVEDAVHHWLACSGALLEHVPRFELLCRIPPQEEALMQYLMPTKPDTQDERFECGVAECNKAFPHEHVGVQTEHQRGLVVSERDISGDEY